VKVLGHDFRLLRARALPARSARSGC
jgi:hypothetical protein